MINIQCYGSPCGELLLGSFEDRLCLCDWAEGNSREAVERRLTSVLGARYGYASTAVTDSACRQLDEYFEGKRTVFDVPLLFAGTEFQKTVWLRLLDIPYGRTVSYGELARMSGRPSSVRAVANANGVNAISIFAPCHRVIGSDGSLTGYNAGVDVKRFLLELERAL